MSTTIKQRAVVEKLPLKHPISLGTEDIVELNFYAPKGRDMKGLPPFAIDEEGNTKIGFDLFLALAEKIIVEPSIVIDELHAEDVMAVIGIASSFFGDSPLTLKMP